MKHDRKGVRMGVRSADESSKILSESIDRLAKENKITPEIAEDIKKASNESAKEGIAKADASTRQVFLDDKKFYRGLLYFLGTAVLITTVGGLILTYYSKDIPQFIVAIGTTALGALAGLLAPSQTQ